MSWSNRRQLLYGSVVLAILLVLVGVPVYFLFLKGQPTCFDGKQDQGEQGVDCGGPCSKSCLDYTASPPVVLWAQDFPVVKGVYNLVAYVENPNVDYVAYPVHYLFTVYDAKGVQIGFRDGYADVPPTKTFPIFEQSFSTGDSVPAKVFFQYLDPLRWKQHNASNGPELQVANQQQITVATGERIEADVVNETVDQYSNVEVVALVYDANGNAQAASRTYIDALAGRASAHVVFTWPDAFTGGVSKIEIVPKLPVAIQP